MKNKIRVGKIMKGVVGSIFAGLCVLFLILVNITTTKTEEIEEPIKYAIKITYDANIRDGVREVKQAGKNGLKKVLYEVTYRNGSEVNRKKQSETIIEESVDEEVTVGTKKYYKCSNGIEYETPGEKDECEKKISWEGQRNRALQECNADASKTNCWYDEYPGTTLHWTIVASSRSSGGRVGAICRDGWRSSATGRGACSHHGGVAQWLYN